MNMVAMCLKNNDNDNMIVKKVLYINEVKKCFPLQRKYCVSTRWVWTKLQQQKRRFIFP